MAGPESSARRGRASAGSALLIAALLAEVSLLACSGAQSEGAPPPGPESPEPPMSEPSLQCTGPRPTGPTITIEALNAKALQRASEPSGAPVDAGAPDDASAGGDAGPLADGGVPGEAAPRATTARLQRPDFGGPPKVVIPPKAFEEGVSGAVVARCIITERGTVQDCCIRQGQPYMDRAVVDALQAMKGRPVMFDGQPVRVEYTWTIRLMSRKPPAAAP